MAFKRKDVLTVAWIVLAVAVGFAMVGVPAIRASQSNEVKLDQVRQWHERDFKNVRSYLDEHGLTFALKPSPTHIDDEVEGCSSGVVQTERGEKNVPVDCYKNLRLRPVAFDDSFIERWKIAADSIEEFVQKDGWKKQYKDQTALKDLFDHAKTSASFLYFVKTHGSVKCEIGFTYNPPYPDLDDQMWMSNNCKRDD